VETIRVLRGTSGRGLGNDKAPARRPLLESPEEEAPALVYQVVAFERMGLVHLGHDRGGRLVRGSVGGAALLLPALPEAELQTLAPLVHEALEEEEKTASLLGVGVGPVVVLSQEVEIRRCAAPQPEGDNVQTVEACAVKWTS
jgi:hypothetical protein